jgi:hypothetical protein
MDVTITKVNERTHIRIYSGGPGAFKEQRFRLYAPNGERLDKELSGGFASLTWEFDIEDYASQFITPYPNQSTGSFDVARETRYNASFGSTAWDETEKQTHSYTIYNNSVTVPTIAMSLSAVGLSSNGYNMAGVTAIQAAFTGSAKLGASVASYTLNVDGKSYGSPYKSDALTTGGCVKVTGVVTDTRGFTARQTADIWVMERMPSLDVFQGNTQYIDGGLSCRLTPPNSAAYSRIEIYSKVGNVYNRLKTLDVGQLSGASTVAVDLTDKLTDIYNSFPSTKDVPLKATLYTYKDEYKTKLSEEYSKEVTLSIPLNDDTKPNISAVSCSGFPVLFNTTDLYVKGKNGAVVNAKAEGRYKASIVNVEWSFEGKEFKNNAASDYFTGFGNKQIIVTATDSRGFTASKTETIHVRDYQKPYISVVSGRDRIIVGRANAEGELDDSDEGVYLKIEAGKKYSDLGGKNKCVLRVRTKERGADHFEDYTELLPRDSADNEYAGEPSITLAPDKIYVVELSVEDDFKESAVYTVAISSSAVFMDRSGTKNSIAFGGHATENNAFEVYHTAYFRGGIYIDDLDTRTRYKMIIRDDGTLAVVTTRNTFQIKR